MTSSSSDTKLRVPLIVDGVAPDARLFERRYGINGPARRVSRALYSLLTSTTPDAPVEERIAWLEKLVGWIASSARTTELFGAPDSSDPRTARLSFLVAVLEREHQLAANARAVVCSIVRDGSLVTLLCSSGMPARAGFFAELLSRSAAQLLPDPPDERDLSRPLLRALEDEEARAWLARIPPPLVSACARLLLDGEARAALERQRQKAAVIVSLRVAALGVSDDVSARMGDGEAPFAELPRAVEGGREALGARLDACVAACERVRAHLDQFGVSTDLVYRLECIDQGVARLRALSSAAVIADLPQPAADRTPVAHLLATVVADADRQRGVLSLMRTSSRQLARKIVERSGHSGEHYITRTRGEWFGMLASAAGGGVLTSGTAVLKLFVGWAALPLFIAGALNSINFAVSFLIMQAVGFTLATKQPSMTAAAIARALEADRADKGHERVVDLVARTVRSQLAAVIGNIGFVIPAAIGLDMLHRYVKGTSFLDAYAASYVVGTLHPLKGGTVFYAALTGVLLWLASVCAGWLDNWVAYRRLPDALAAHPGLRRFLGKRGAAWLGRKIGQTASGFAGCVSLGVLLGMVPVMAAAFGLPLDVRHVTLSTGALTLAVRGAGLDAFFASGGAWAIVGIAIIGLLNFTVSFACALAVAIRARDIRWRENLQVVGAVLRALVTSPGRFLFPPATPAAEAAKVPAAHH